MPGSPPGNKLPAYSCEALQLCPEGIPPTAPKTRTEAGQAGSPLSERYVCFFHVHQTPVADRYSRFRAWRSFEARGPIDAAGALVYDVMGWTLF